MTETDYDPKQDPWYSPHVIIDYFEHLRLQYKEPMETDFLFKKAREMFSASVAVFGAYELSSENQYYLQLNRQGTSPDIVAGMHRRQDGVMNWIMTQMEIVEMESHSKTDDVVDFLLDTKLSPRKGYNQWTMIVCFVNRKIPLPRQEIHDRLMKLSPKSTIYIYGRPLDAPMGTFVTFSPYPKLTLPVTYNINDTAKKYSLKPRLTLSKGVGDKMLPVGSVQVNLFDVLGLDQKKINQKFNVKY